MYTYTLAILYLIISLCLFIFTRKNYIGLFHIGLIMGIVPYVIRPILSETYGGWTIYESKYQMESDYFFIYLVTVIFNFSFFIGYLVRMLSERKIKLVKQNIGYIPKPYFPMFLVCCMFLYLFSVSGINWLGNFRQEAASNITPAFRFIYPTVIFICYYLAISTYFYAQKKRKKGLLYFVLFFIFISITLLNTRGWFISIIFLLFSFYFSKHKISVKSVVKMSLIVAFVVFYMRSIIGFLFGNNNITANESVGLYQLLLGKFLFTSSGDTIDVWNIVIDYVKDNGYLYGQTLIGNILLLFPSSVRKAFELQPALDMVNYYYYGDLYYQKNFGFNINLKQELFINFGYIALLFVFITGYLYRYFEFKIFTKKVITIKVILQICFYIQVINLTGSFASMSWFIFFFVFYKGIFLIWQKLPKKKHI